MARRGRAPRSAAPRTLLWGLAVPGGATAGLVLSLVLTGRVSLIAVVAGAGLGLMFAVLIVAATWRSRVRDAAVARLHPGALTLIALRVVEADGFFESMTDVRPVDVGSTYAIAVDSRGVHVYSGGRAPHPLASIRWGEVTGIYRTAAHSAAFSYVMQQPTYEALTLHIDRPGHREIELPVPVMTWRTQPMSGDRLRALIRRVESIRRADR
ncbi:hypothetical protein ACFJGV_09935 [Cnuibacter sp. UC19_7]|uniref:hypothetical protein n=1 Tax=Cnuibacter sp. UC19_7 TaxID=3350166 RepID=UPI00366D3A99